jgi:hypothetical protein
VILEGVLKRVLFLILAVGCYTKDNAGNWVCSCKNSRAVESGTAPQQQEIESITDLFEDYVEFSFE